MRKKYKVSFEIEGDDISDDFPLNKDNIVEFVMHSFDTSGSCVRGGPYTSVSNLVVEKMKRRWW